MREISARFDVLSFSGVFEHIITKETEHLILVRKQRRIAESINDILDDKKRNGPLTPPLIENLKQMLDEAKEINFFHPSVRNGESILKKLHIAQQSVELMKNASDLTTGQLETVIAALNEYKNMVTGADTAIQSASAKLTEIRSETDRYVPELTGAFRQDSVQFDHLSGGLKQGGGVLSEQLQLSRVLESLSGTTLRSKECKVLRSCGELFRSCRSAARSSQVDEVMDILKVFDTHCFDSF